MKKVDPLRSFFLALVCKPHDCSHVMKNTHTNGRGDSAARNMVRVAFCTKLGAEEWTEELLTDQEEQIPAATKWAEANGYKVRVANINLGVAPNWAACVNV